MEKIKSNWSLEKCFEELRNDKNHHIGLGDIRLTIGQQEEIVKLVNEKIEERFTFQEVASIALEFGFGHNTIGEIAEALKSRRKN